MRSRLPDLFLDVTAATGVSLAGGPGTTPIVRVEQLPEFRLELHTFWSTDSACLFEEGLATIGGGNKVVWDHHPTGDFGGRILIAHLQEDRPVGAELRDVVPIIDHRPRGEDGRRVARHTTEAIAQRQQEESARRECEAPAIARLAELGTRALHGNWASVGLRLPGGDHEAASIVALLHNETWHLEVKLQDHNLYLWERPLEARLDAALRASGWLPKPEGGGEWTCVCPTLDEVAAASDRLRVAERQLPDILLEIWRERTAANKLALKAERKVAAAARRRALHQPGKATLAS